MFCQIVLSSPGDVYSPSEEIKGKVIVDLQSSGTIRGIFCKLIGKEETKWNENESYYDQRAKISRAGIVHYKGEHFVLSLDYRIATDESVTAGRHEFPFTITLPNRLSSTYISNYGSIQYNLNTIVDIGPTQVREDNIPIFIKAPIDFNLIKSELQMAPIVYQNEEVIWHCCYAGDPVTMDLILEKEAYVLGETMNIKLDVNNKSDEDILEIDVTLTLVVEATATTPKKGRKYYEKLLTGAKLDGLEGGIQNLYSFRFQLSPELEVPNFIGSVLFRQKCVLKAEAKIRNSDTKLDVQTEIKLGHIALETSRRINHPHGPVRRVHSSGAINRPLGFNFFNSSTNNTGASAPPAEGFPSAPSKTTDDIDSLPPSYDEAIRTTVINRKTKKE